MTKIQNHFKELMAYFKSDLGSDLSNDLRAPFDMVHFKIDFNIEYQAADITIQNFDTGCDHEIIDRLESEHTVPVPVPVDVPVPAHVQVEEHENIRKSFAGLDVATKTEPEIQHAGLASTSKKTLRPPSYFKK